MSEIQIIILFFTFLFAANLFYSAKSKNKSLFSYIINLEFEYIIVGIALFFMTDSMPLPKATLNAAMHLLLTFMGLALGTHFSIKLLLEVPLRFYSVTLLIYFALFPVFYFIFKITGSENPIMMSIAMNTLMPYSLNLSMKLFRLPKDKLFVSNLIASLFPLITLLAYTTGAGVLDFRPVDFTKSIAAGLLLTAIFLHYGKSKSKKNINKLSILFVVMLTGISMYYTISPLVLGFLTGIFKADTKYGNIFQNLSISFERILYIFFYVALGVMLAFGYDFSIKSFAAAAMIFIGIYAVRHLMAKFVINKVMPAKGEVVCLMSIGILPAVILLDYGTRHGYESISKLFIPFLLVHLATEILTYLMMKNERKTD